MPENPTRGPKIADDEDVYRAILYPTQWLESEKRPSTAIFKVAVFSVDVMSKTTPEETIGRFTSVIKLVRFNCGNARTLDFDTRDEPDEKHPDNKAHAHVYFDAETERKIKARKLIDDFCSWSNDSVYPEEWKLSPKPQTCREFFVMLWRRLTRAYHTLRRKTT